MLLKSGHPLLCCNMYGLVLVLVDGVCMLVMCLPLGVLRSMSLRVWRGSRRPFILPVAGKSATRDWLHLGPPHVERGSRSLVCIEDDQFFDPGARVYAFSFDSRRLLSHILQPGPGLCSCTANDRSDVQ